MDTMSRMIVRESSNFEETSSDEELRGEIKRKDFLLSTKRLIKSSKKLTNDSLTSLKSEKLTKSIKT